MPSGELHRVKLEVLLWALEAFSDIPTGPDAPVLAQCPRTLTPRQIRQVRQIASSPRASLQVGSELTGIPYDQLRTFVWRTRHGHEPAYWRLVA